MQRANTLLVIALAAALRAQTPPEAVPLNDRATQVPVSGRSGQAGGVATVQTALPGGSQSVNTINSTLQVQGSFQGSTPSSQTAGAPLAISLDDALKRGLQYNLGQISQQNAVRKAQGEHAVERSNLMPHFSGDLMYVDQQINLAALGFGNIQIPGLAFPSIIGPFHYFDLRAGGETVFDLTRLRNYRSSRETARAAELNAQDARDLVALAVTGEYIQIIATGARVDSLRAQVTTAQATNQQAQDRLKAGVSARIDATRTQVELQTQQQRLTSTENDLAKLKILFARLIGLPPAQEFSLTDTLPYAPLAGIDVDQALARAYANRSDLKAAEAQVRAAEISRSAAMAERYPSVQVSGDYGVIGPSPANSHGTFNVTTGLRFPIWQGGRVRGDIEQANAALEQRRSEFQDLRGRIDAEVRMAFLDLNSAASQVRLAESNRGLANETLTQARDRFAAGVADTLEVVQAQQAVATAEQDFIASLYGHNLAKAALARAMGEAGQNMRQFVGRP